MKPIDYRNETWQDILPRLNQQRLAVYQAWKDHGPGTTREIARRSGIDILTLRPRTTELYQLGLLELADQKSKIKNQKSTEGIYLAVSIDTARARFEAARREARQPQLEMEALLR